MSDRMRAEIKALHAAGVASPEIARRLGVAPDDRFSQTETFAGRNLRSLKSAG